MKKKNPWVAAILNLFLPRIGFAYLGLTVLVVGGIVLFISDFVVGIIYYKHTLGIATSPSCWVFSILGVLSLAVITSALKKIYNRSIQTQSETPEENS